VRRFKVEQALGPGGWQFFDLGNYGERAWTDEEFAREFNERDPNAVVRPPDEALGEASR
jgi:hypothetical protein